MVSLRKSSCKRNMKGGGAGGSYIFAPSSSSSPLIANKLEYTPVSNCQLAVGGRFGTIPNVDTGGLPGFKGGMRLRKKRNTRRQRGGGYGIGPYDGTVMGYPGSSGIAGILHNGCTAPSQTQLPVSAASDSLNSRSSELWQKGGAQLSGSLITEADAPLSSATTAAQSITVPTAGYTHLNGAASVGGSSTGVPYMINVPADGRASSSHTGASSASMHGGKRGRKSRSSSRKNRQSKRRANGSRRSRKVNRR
jgi:hypothetical protein